MDAKRNEDGVNVFYQLSQNSPFQEHIYSVWSGGESNAHQAAGCARIKEMMATVVAEHLKVVLAGTEYLFEVEFVIGGDYPWVASALGLVGHIGSYPCVWCEVKKEDLGAVMACELDKPGFIVPRTKARHQAWAHLGGYCSTCKKTFASNSTTAAQSWFNAQTKNAQKQYSSKHAGIYHLQGYAEASPGWVGT